MKNNFVVYMVTLLNANNFKWYISMNYDEYKDMLLSPGIIKDKKRNRCIIKKNLTSLEAYNFCKILNKLKSNYK